MADSESSGRQVVESPQAARLARLEARVGRLQAQLDRLQGAAHEAAMERLEDRGEQQDLRWGLLELARIVLGPPLPPALARLSPIRSAGTPGSVELFGARDLSEPA